MFIVTLLLSNGLITTVKSFQSYDYWTEFCQEFGFELLNFERSVSA